jgi:hypothetical protein
MGSRDNSCPLWLIGFFVRQSKWASTDGCLYFFFSVGQIDFTGISVKSSTSPTSFWRNGSA